MRESVYFKKEKSGDLLKSKRVFCEGDYGIWRGLNFQGETPQTCITFVFVFVLSLSLLSLSAFSKSQEFLFFRETAMSATEKSENQFVKLGIAMIEMEIHFCRYRNSLYLPFANKAK